MKNFKVVNGTFFDERTPDEVVAILEHARLNRTRLHVSLGETDNDRGQLGLDWLEESFVTGYIGRSTGSVKIPLVVPNRNSTGGPGLLDHCVVRIRRAAGGQLLWIHPQYHHGTITLARKPIPVDLPDGRQLTVTVFRDGQEQAAFENMDKARRYLRKLGLKAEVERA
jgi:hypothetical protein